MKLQWDEKVNFWVQMVNIIYEKHESSWRQQSNIFQAVISNVKKIPL